MRLTMAFSWGLFVLPAAGAPCQASPSLQRHYDNLSESIAYLKKRRSRLPRATKEANTFWQNEKSRRQTLAKLELSEHPDGIYQSLRASLAAYLDQEADAQDPSLQGRRVETWVSAKTVQILKIGVATGLQAEVLDVASETLGRRLKRLTASCAEFR